MGGEPRYLLMEPKLTTFPIKTFEVQEIVKLAEQKGIKFNLREYSCCYLPKEKTRVVFDYAFDHSVCPFLDQNYRCKIYSARPLICKMFPIRASFNSKERIISPVCPNMLTPKLSSNGSYEQSIQELYDAYGSSAIAANNYFDLTELEDSFMHEAMNAGRLELRPYHHVWREMESAKKLDFCRDENEINAFLKLKNANTLEEYFAI